MCPGKTTVGVSHEGTSYPCSTVPSRTCSVSRGTWGCCQTLTQTSQSRSTEPDASRQSSSSMPSAGRSPNQVQLIVEGRFTAADREFAANKLWKLWESHQLVTPVGLMRRRMRTKELTTVLTVWHVRGPRSIVLSDLREEWEA